MQNVCYYQIYVPWSVVVDGNKYH